MENIKKMFFVLGLHYILYKPLSKSLIQKQPPRGVPRKRYSKMCTVCGNFAAKLGLYTYLNFVAL